jgi:hypothetical protein
VGHSVSVNLNLTWELNGDFQGSGPGYCDFEPETILDRGVQLHESAFSGLIVMTFGFGMPLSCVFG